MNSKQIETIHVMDGVGTESRQTASEEVSKSWQTRQSLSLSEWSSIKIVWLNCSRRLILCSQCKQWRIKIKNKNIKYERPEAWSDDSICNLIETYFHFLMRMWSLLLQDIATRFAPDLSLCRKKISCGSKLNQMDIQSQLPPIDSQFSRQCRGWMEKSNYMLLVSITQSFFLLTCNKFTSAELQLFSRFHRKISKWN